MKKVWAFALIGLISLTGCSSKSYNNIYDETLSAKETKELDDVLNELVAGFTVRYSFDDNLASQTAQLFTNPEMYLGAYQNYKARKQGEIGPGIDDSKLYVDTYMTNVKNTYEDAKEWGLLHGLLYTSGKHTGFEPVMEEITPLKEGETLDKLSQSEMQTEVIEQESEVESSDSLDTEAESEVNEVENLVNEETLQNKYEGEMSDDEYREYLNELSEQEPDYLVLTREMIEEDISNYTEKQELVNYCYSKLTVEMKGDWGDYEPTEEEIVLNFLCYYGYDEEGNGIINEEIWENFSFDEAKEQLIKVLLYGYDTYNQSLLASYEYMNSDEFKQQFIDSREEARREKESREAEERLAESVSEYDLWRLSEKDMIEFVEGLDFEEPVFSEVIKQDSTGYYILWEEIYKLADEEGRLTEGLEFIAYGQPVNIKMPEAPLSYYKDKKVSLESWNLVVDSSGREQLELNLSLPDKLYYVTVTVMLDKDNKLVYTTDIASNIFD